ncbi:elongation factor G [Paenibacillus protaetiae]|uniref:TetM/TetW/TetO/TetS family tetracycline resistance ribosomal protection protein n=1 Tax=Paenibacillus protaetiae TaxID=2509456 RepID=A0A4P6F2L5_9BACL|nr:TetM/TetW/TetO/TetS family tetracycline resistance ribosomal protection protein [Paenibacillus protaetiae]QAY68389.1 TetM/TetW/TetO/TetS family tetracycline resistance ribosomal protection protein [Paenibacillus protaetiae]
MEQYATIGLLAHVDAGKTTFAEQLLYHTGSIRSRGRVDHRDAYLDSHELEKARGITIFADQAVMKLGHIVLDLIDTPGHVDFSAEMERAVQVMDYAVVIISAVEGVEGHTETVWRLLEKHRIPTLCFINKMDRSGADAEAVLDHIRQHLSPDVLLLDAGMSGGIPEHAAEFAAERDEELLESYLEGEAAGEQVLAAMQKLVAERRLIPAVCGSALLDQGIDVFLECLSLLMAPDYDRHKPFAAKVYKIRHDQQGVRLTYMKLTQGGLSVRDELAYTDASGEAKQEKITSIRSCSGPKWIASDRVYAGQLAVVTGLSSAEAGDGLGEQKERARYELAPALKSKVLLEPSMPAREALRFFRQLDAEDPSLGVVWDEALQEIQVHVMGTIQLEVLEHLIAERFQMNVSFGPPEILYKETITGTTIGYGHFEPLGHFAEVHLQIDPAPRNSGVTFINHCHPDDLAGGFQHVIGQYMTEKEHRGLLAGSPVTDVTITLLTGRSHNKHTSGGDFREAALRAFRQGLEKTSSMLLEPYYAFKLTVGIDQIGRAMSDIQQAHGTFDPPEMYGDTAVMSGAAPVATFMNYAAELASYTKGKGALSLKLAGYRPCHQAERIIADRQYDKDADPEYTSSSIFCAKGKGFSIPWTDVESYLSIKIK